jgi:hypothetical protein
MKTNELKDQALDWAVARCEGGVGKNQLLGAWYAPSTNWAQGGPIIEREKIDVSVQFYGWVAHHGKYRGKEMNQPYYTQKADTPLIAAMRCFVASKLGDDIDIPEELK